MGLVQHQALDVIRDVGREIAGQHDGLQQRRTKGDGREHSAAASAAARHLMCLQTSLAEQHQLASYELIAGCCSRS